MRRKFVFWVVWPLLGPLLSLWWEVEVQIKLLDQIGSVHIDLDSANLFCVLGRVSDYSQELYPEERVDWG